MVITVSSLKKCGKIEEKMALGKIKPMMEDKAYVMREKESYRIPEAVLREHLGKEGKKQFWYEVEGGGIVNRKFFKVVVDPNTNVLRGVMAYYLDVKTVDNVEVKGWVGIRKSAQGKRLLQDGKVRLTRPGVEVSLAVSLEEAPYNHESFVKQYLKDGHFIFDIDFEISVKKEKFMVKRREENLMKDMKTIFDRETSPTDFRLVCEGQELPCHKALLQARSSVFKQGIEFNEGQGVPEASTKFEIKESHPFTVNFMLNHIYGEGLISEVDNMYINKVDEVIPDPEDLLHLANYFDLPELVKICKEGIIWKMTPENAVQTLVNIDKHAPEDKEVKDKVISFIKKHANDVIQSEGWGVFVNNYGDLVTDIVRAMANSE